MARLAMLGVLTIGLSACEQKETAADRGPAEKAGEKIDQAAAKASVHLNKLAEQAGKGLQQAGEKIQGAARDAQQPDPKEKKE